MKLNTSSFLFLFPILLHAHLFAQVSHLKNDIIQVIAAKKATVGVAVYGLEDADSMSIHGDSHLPMQSVFKFPIALAVLKLVDQKKLSLDQVIITKRSDLMVQSWSPMRDNYPNQDIKMRLDSILGYTVSQSDNNGCDILLKLIGGPKTVNDYIHSIAVKEFSIKTGEKEMQKDWQVQFTNWITPLAANQLIRLFFNRKLLSETSYNFLWNIMTATTTGQHRIKGQLPPGTRVAHKTGTSATNDKGITAAVNDIGIVTLPNENHFAISVFVTNSSENEATNEKIIADITKLTWDYFLHKSH